jgi:hypothetical protein
MSNKKWYENLPQHGTTFLVNLTEEFKDDIPYFLASNKLLQDTLEDELELVRPATMQEIWKLLPWKSMDTAPKDGTTFLFKYDVNNSIGLCKYHESNKQFKFYNDGGLFTTISDPKNGKWVELPN